jgi:predicted dehydrogenase
MVFPKEDAAQFEIARDCLLAGASVLCERPVFHTLEEAEELIALQKQSGCFVMPRYNRRYMPAYISTKHLLQSAEFGKPRMYCAVFHAGPYGGEDEFIVNHIGHHLDLARFLVGEVSLVDIRAIRSDNSRIGYNIVFEGSDGMLGNIQCNSFLCGDYPLERLEISGDGRRIIAENVRMLLYQRPFVRLGDTGAVDLTAAGGVNAMCMNNAQLNNHTYYGFENMVREFIRCGSERIPPPQDAEDAGKTFRLIREVLEYRKKNQ